MILKVITQHIFFCAMITTFVKVIYDLKKTIIKKHLRKFINGSRKFRLVKFDEIFMIILAIKSSLFLYGLKSFM